MALLTIKRCPASGANHFDACSHLMQADSVLPRIIMQVGTCTLRKRRDAFATLCDSIISQQLSPAAATTIYDRFAQLYPNRRPTPQLVIRTSSVSLRTAGLSGQKAGYLRDLASGFLDGRIRPNRFARRSNEEIITELASIKGIGRWTAEMFLIFSLNRLDVLPVDDLGIKKAVQRWYRLPAIPVPAILRRVAKPWHPYESIACWYLWQNLRL